MEYSKLLDLASDLGYELAMCGAETFRVEETVTLVLKAYDVDAEVFVIPNCMHISIEPVIGRPVTRMRRIGYHGNDLDGVEKFSGLSRAICNRTPPPEIAQRWLEETRNRRSTYSLPWYLLGDFLGAAGFAIFFGGSWADALCSGLCGILVGLILKFMDRLKANQFFTTIIASFLMAVVAYLMAHGGLVPNPDAVVIGALMILVPGLLFTNAMRDIIYGDTNSGMNRIVQVLLIALAIALGTASAWSVISALVGTPVSAPDLVHPWYVMAVACLLGCAGFTILFNIHGKGSMLCILGGVLTWAVYALTAKLLGNELAGFFWGSFFASLYSETMARVRKCPAIAYLVVCIFPLIPGAGVYYTMHYAVQGQMGLFAEKGMYTAATAGLMAVGIVLVSTAFRLWTNWRREHKKA
ncbi:MAG: threonine/serine exporter family protein [Ruminococcaceae bacterium]|nr:threonine/serine exporter family protein [Oscillospiraceae bacterium]